MIRISMNKGQAVTIDATGDDIPPTLKHGLVEAIKATIEAWQLSHLPRRSVVLDVQVTREG